MSASMSVIAKRFLFVRETEGPNAGTWVAFFLHFTGNTEGESWCASFVSMVNHIATKGRMTVTKTASTIAMLSDARIKGWVVTDPQIDDLVFTVHPDTGLPHHVAIVSALTPLSAVAGNTSSDGTSSNGDGCYEHPISPDNKVFVRLPT